MRIVAEILPLAFGEHGGHAIHKGPDGCFYVIGGNDTSFDKVKLDPSSPIKNPQAGCLLRISENTLRVECIAQGFRNPYDFDFTPNGDIITYDSDTERDFLTTLNEVGQGRSIILIAHRLVGVERLDRIWRLSGGKAVAAAA